MTLPTGFAPRTAAARRALAARMLQPPQAVEIDPGDDGYEAACLQIAGHTPLLPAGAQPGRVNAALARLGLAPVGEPLPSPPHNAPLVTILVCTFNRAGMLPEALASAKAQRWPVEIVVVDDGSTDDTPAVLAATPGIVALRQEPNQGKPAALNRGLQAAQGQAILVLDDDDRLFPGALSVLAPALFARPEAAAVLADTVQFRTTDGTVGGLGTALRAQPGRLRAAVLQQVPSWPGATLVRADAQAQAGPYHLGLNMLEDMDMYLRLSRVGPLHTLPLPTLAYRLHDGARGGAAERRLQRDRVETRVARTARAAPVFRERWQAWRGESSRAEGFAWAQGLHLRGLADEAVEELQRWPAPWSLAETRTRRRLGLTAPEPRLRAHAVVVHDGEVGALADTLDRVEPWQAPHVLEVVPRETPDALDVAVPHGVLESGRGLAAALPGQGPWVLRCSSDPNWASPLVSDRALVLGVADPRVALRATALALGWPTPQARRACVPPPQDAVLARLEQVAAAPPGPALALLLPVVQAAPGWKAAWRWAARLAQAQGRPRDAAAFAARGR